MKNNFSQSNRRVISPQNREWNGFRGFFIIALMWTATSLYAADPSFEVSKACRAQLAMLKEATEEYLKNGKAELPKNVTPFDQIYTMLLTAKYLPKKPGKPTPDCEYFLVAKSPTNYDWFCNLHGVLSGDPDQRLTFPYHEYEFTALFKKTYMDIENYKKHYNEVMRWAVYSRTLTESIKYSYSKNPTTTIGMVIFGLVVVFFLYKNLFE